MNFPNTRPIGTRVRHGSRLFVWTTLALLAGCASVVYKDAASGYVTAAQALTRQIDSAAASVAKAEDQVKLARLITDANCPVAENRLFVREPAARAARFSPLLARYPDLAGSRACVQLLACENSDQGACAGACFTAEEGLCLVRLERNLAIQSKVPADASDAAKAEAEQAARQAALLADQLQRIEYGRSVTTPNQIVSDGLGVLAEYLDLLGKLVDRQTSDIDSDGKRFVDRLTKLSDGYAALSGTPLSSSAQASRGAIGNYVGAFGKLAADIDTMRRNARDAEKIKLIVKGNTASVEAVISAVTPVVSGDVVLGVTLGNLSVLDLREGIQKRFSAAPGEYSRLQAFSELTKYPFATSAASRQQLQAVFDQLSKANANLVSLVNNPNDEQLKAIRSEQLQGFRTLVSDLGGVIALFK